VDDWTTMTLRIEDPAEPDPRRWPVVATGAKVGFCLMDYGTCSYYNGHCRTSQEYGGGAPLTNGDFPNYGLNGSYGCGANIQGISVGRTDIYSENLDMMWINLMDGLCNGNYWIVAEVDPTDVFFEEDDDNNWTAIPFALTQQRPAGSGGTAGIMAPDGLRTLEGGSVVLVATPGYAYLWSNGATTRSISVSQGGEYSVSVTAPCGTLVSGTVTVSVAAPLAAPVAQHATVTGPASAVLGATGAGAEIVWYDVPSGGQALATGNTFATPVLNATTSYYASTRTVLPGVSAFGGKTDLTGSSVNSSNLKQSLIFDAYEPFDLVSVKVYATGNGERHFILVDNAGNLLQERYVYVPSGTQRVQLDFKVPAGSGYRITAFNDNTEIVRNLHRDAGGVSYPYAIGTLGAITGSTAGTGHYYYLYDWEVRTPDVVVESPRTAVTATVVEGVRIDLRAILGGPFNASTGLMGDALRVAGLVPMTEPYTAMGFIHAGGGGGEMIAAGMLDAAGNGAIVDWVLVELRDVAQPSLVRATRSALVRRDGRVLGPDGAPVLLDMPHGDYYVALRHRNHLGCMTALPVTLSGMAVMVDLASPTLAAWGNDARKDVDGTMVLWSGNVAPDNMLKYTGVSNDRDPVLSAVGGLVPTNTLAGYHSADANLDGLVKYTGAANDRDLILANIGGEVPTLVRTQQLP